MEPALTIGSGVKYLGEEQRKGSWASSHQLSSDVINAFVHLC